MWVETARALHPQGSCRSSHCGLHTFVMLYGDGPVRPGPAPSGLCVQHSRLSRLSVPLPPAGVTPLISVSGYPPDGVGESGVLASGIHTRLFSGGLHPERHRFSQLWGAGREDWVQGSHASRCEGEAPGGWPLAPWALFALPLVAKDTECCPPLSA